MAPQVSRYWYRPDTGQHTVVEKTSTRAELFSHFLNDPAKLLNECVKLLPASKLSGALARIA